MKVYTVTNDFFPAIRGLFSKHGGAEVLPTNYRNIPDFSADVIVLAGGEDINPERYKENGRNGYYNDHRDTWELKVFKDILTGKLKTKKVLGICRGMQLINVGLGGTLYYDIFERFHTSHESPHDIKHLVYNTALSFLEKVNSLHHQGLCVLGSTPKSPYKVLAVEPNTRVPEIVIWGDGMLGVQFHPEFFSDENEAKWKFADTIKTWAVDGSKIILEQSPRNKPRTGSVEYQSEQTVGVSRLSWDDLGVDTTSIPETHGAVVGRNPRLRFVREEGDN